MPLKLNVGLNRKVGEPNYGSRGASINLELELDSAVIDSPDRLRDRFADAGPDLRSLLLRVAEVRRWGLLLHPVARRWQGNGLVLLGDAAHPMTPNLGQGGCQAIEDAVVLAGALAEECSVEAALAHYEARRIPRANRFVTRSRALGRLAHVRATPLRWLRDRVLASVPRRAALRALEKDLAFER